MDVICLRNVARADILWISLQEDRGLNESKKPAIKKLTQLPYVKAQLQK